MSQKGHWTTKKNNQKWIILFYFPFKAMAIMASYCFCIRMNVKEFKSKMHLMKF
jgi:hypothetical protein